jgi:hypothetical protein
MSGTSVGASGETVVDIKASGRREIREALCITFDVRKGEGMRSLVVPAHAGT